jgi:hypothetical protein
MNLQSECFELRYKLQSQTELTAEWRRKYQAVSDRMFQLSMRIVNLRAKLLRPSVSISLGTLMTLNDEAMSAFRYQALRKGLADDLRDILAECQPPAETAYKPAGGD